MTSTSGLRARCAGGPRLALRLAAAGLASLLVAGCTLGPDFVRPKVPAGAAYAAGPLPPVAATPGVAGGQAQQWVSGADVSGQWWRLFHSTTLDRLVAAALSNNHSLKAAKATLRAAHEGVLAQRASFFPTVSADIAASRQQDPSATLSPTPASNALLYSLITPQLSVSYAPDLFGLNRRTRESLQAQTQAVRFRMIAAWTTLTTNVVVTAVQGAALREQLQATRQLIALEKKSLGVLQLRFRKGDASRLDVSAQRAQVALTEVGLPALVKQRAATTHALDVLVGTFPDQSPAKTLTLADLRLPKKLPLSLPSTLVEQRPDVRQARADLHAASAAIGIATAERLPQIELTADAGDSALAISRLFTSGTGFWGLAASLTAPIFEAGRLKHQQRAAKAAYVAAAQTYRDTVLRAFQGVADCLVALDEDAHALNAAASAAKAAATTLALARLKLRHGAIDSAQLLAAEQAAVQARIDQVQAEANRFADTAALYQALGGGWWHDPDLSGKT